MSDINIQSQAQIPDILRDTQELEEDRLKHATGQIQSLITELTMRLTMANVINEISESNRKMINNSIRELKSTQRESQELSQQIDRLRDLQQHSTHGIAPTDSITSNGHANAGIDALNQKRIAEAYESEVKSIADKYGIDLGQHDSRELLARLRAKLATAADDINSQLALLHQFVGRYEAEARETGAAVGAAQTIAAQIESELGASGSV